MEVVTKVKIFVGPPVKYSVAGSFETYPPFMCRYHASQCTETNAVTQSLENLTARLTHSIIRSNTFVKPMIFGGPPSTADLLQWHATEGRSPAPLVFDGAEAQAA